MMVVRARRKRDIATSYKKAAWSYSSIETLYTSVAHMNLSRRKRGLLYLAASSSLSIQQINNRSSRSVAIILLNLNGTPHPSNF